MPRCALVYLIEAMKILYIGRIFSGLENSLLSEEWAPTGVPTVYKILEALDNTPHELYIVLINRGVSRNFQQNWHHSRPTEMRLKGLNAKVLVIPGGTDKGLLPGRIRRKLTEASQLRTVYRIIKSFDPSLVYVDRSNVFSGAMAARWFAKQTLLRIMGVYPSMWDIVNGDSLMTRLERWAFRSPFALALCTQDGTGGGGMDEYRSQSKGTKNYDAERCSSGSTI